MTDDRHIFVSHAAANDDAVNRFNETFREASITMWIDHLSLKIGDNWNAAIQTALESCIAGLFLLTPESSGSDECGAEWRTVLGLHKRLYVAVLGDVQNFPWRLRTHQYVDLNVNATEGIQLLVRAIQVDVLPKQVATPSQIERGYAGSLMPLRLGVFGVVRLVLDMTVSFFQTIRTAFLRFLANILGLPDDDIDTLGIDPGSTIVTLRLPREAAQLLVEVFQAEPQCFSEYRVRSATLIPEYVPPTKDQPRQSVAAGEPEPTHAQHAHAHEDHERLKQMGAGVAAGTAAGFVLGGPIGAAVGGALGALGGILGQLLGQGEETDKSGEKRRNEEKRDLV